MGNTQARSEMGLNVIRLLAFGMLLIFPATSEAQQSPPIAEQIAKTYGLDSFGQIEAIRYTWNVESPNGTVSRSWEWSPKTDTVSYEGKDVRHQMHCDSLRRCVVEAPAHRLG
jgi:hypothetical protein